MSLSDQSISHVDVGRLDYVPDAAQLFLHVLELRLDGLKPFALLGGYTIHLLVHCLHKLADVALRKDV